MPTTSPLRVAVLDADSGFARVLLDRVAGAGWELQVLSSPVTVEAVAALRVHAVLLDPSMLGTASWTYLEKLCMRLPQTGAIVCTAKSSVAERIRGLRLGADDWLTKPAHPDEVTARVEAVVRRRKRAEAARLEESPSVVGELEIRADQFQAFAGRSQAGLTRREFELLQLLVASEGQVLPREEIYERVWGYPMVRGDRSVDVFVRKLRLKLERISPDWRYVHTHFGIGYRFAAQSTDDTDPAANAADAPARRPVPV